MMLQVVGDTVQGALTDVLDPAHRDKAVVRVSGEAGVGLDVGLVATQHPRLKHLVVYGMRPIGPLPTTLRTLAWIPVTHYCNPVNVSTLRQVLSAASHCPHLQVFATTADAFFLPDIEGAYTGSSLVSMVVGPCTPQANGVAKPLYTARAMQLFGDKRDKATKFAPDRAGVEAVHVVTCGKEFLQTIQTVDDLVNLSANHLRTQPCSAYFTAADIDVAVARLSAS